MDILRYKSYSAGAEYDAERHVWSCKILFIRDFVSFQGEFPEEIQRNFEATVDDYRETCEAVGKDPDKP